MTAEYKPYTWIENKGIAKTVFEQNGHQIKNKINWDVNYDGKKAHINFDMDDNGKHKNLEMNLDNNDIMKILELGSNPNSLDKRLENDFIKNDYEYEPESVPLFFSNDDNAMNKMNELYNLDNLDKLDKESESPVKPQIIQLLQISPTEFSHSPAPFSTLKAPACSKIQIPIQKRIIKRRIQKPTIQKPTIQKPTIQKPTIQKPTIQKPTIQKPNLITRRYKTPSPKTMRIHLTKSSVARGLKKTKTKTNKKTTRRGPLRRFLRNLI